MLTNTQKQQQTRKNETDKNTRGTTKNQRQRACTVASEWFRVGRAVDSHHSRCDWVLNGSPFPRRIYVNTASPLPLLYKLNCTHTHTDVAAYCSIYSLLLLTLGIVQNAQTCYLQVLLFASRAHVFHLLQRVPVVSEIMCDTASVRLCTQQETARLMAAQKESGTSDDGRLHLPHVTIVPPEQLHASTFLENIKQHATDEEARASCPTATSGPNRWLLTVPTCLRHDLRATVQYLCMVVAIDFRHWAEQPCDLTQRLIANSKIKVNATRAAPERLATPGEAVASFAGFYTVVSPRTDHSVTSSSSCSGQTTILYPEQASSSAPSADATFLRGSAAMMHLLREAVDVHGLHWYDPAFLASFASVEDATQALKVCFVGCERDGLTPMWMPATKERVGLLLSLRDTLQANRTSFFELLQGCDGYVFGRTSAFVPQLRALHPRYQDVARASALFGDDREFPILKLSQLTALALNDALPDFWRASSGLGTTGIASTAGDDDCASGWLKAARAAVCGGLTPVQGLFRDADSISICCDYQIPKALRAAGLLVYDDHLASMVDNHVLLSVGGLEEVVIRVATLISTEWLITWLNDHAAEGSPALQVTSLDHALWYVGRYMTEATAKHHLCRTIMY